MNQKLQSPETWDNPKRAAEIAEEISSLKAGVQEWKNLQQETQSLLNDLLDLKEMEWADNEEEKVLVDLQNDFNQKFLKIEKRFNQKKIEAFLNNSHDNDNALITIYSGAGGTEAQDWAEMLLRMYYKYAQRKGFKPTVLHYHAGQEAGIKSATLKVAGRLAYGYLKKEKGVRRLVRISPFSANNLRHTSFALVEVLPEIKELPEIQIKPEDLRIDTYRASGAGGQYVNKTESAVRIKHLPTGITVECQSERSQGANREQAMKMLYSRLYQQSQLEKEKEIKKLKGKKISEGTAEWGSQIRSYILHPYKLVKDLRTNVESRQPEEVLDGNLEPFIEAEIISG